MWLAWLWAYFLIIPFDETAETLLDPGLEKPVEWMGTASVDLNLGKDVELRSIAGCIGLDLLGGAWFLHAA